MGNAFIFNNINKKIGICGQKVILEKNTEQITERFCAIAVISRGKVCEILKPCSPLNRKCNRNNAKPPGRYMPFWGSALGKRDLR
jgi:hypothetical protein